jgi:membrane protease YdiL (CAAX protease family)
VVSILVAYFENPSESDSVSSMIDDIISNFRSSIVISIIFAALMEELLFRYYILSILVKRGINQYLAILISSLLFSIIHIFSYNVYVLIYITFLGIGFGMLYILIKNIGAPLGLHFTINYLAAIYEANEEYNPSNFIDVIIGNSTLNWYLLLIMLAWVLNLIIRKQTLNKL